jgi:capsular polysaccharide biosynthesis protein
MSAPSVLEVLARRWWLILIVTAVAVASAWAYARTVDRRYQATATVIAHPSAVVTKASDYSNDLSLLSYGSIEQTFASLARSSTMLARAGSELGVSAQSIRTYNVIANVFPASTVLEISVQGPDPRVAVKLANKLADDVSTATLQYFQVFELTPLDPAGVTLQVSPRTRRDMLFAGLAGVLVAIVLAALSLSFRRAPETHGRTT